ncbi:hypothetical protein OO014_07605 [Intrasporangium calvum]|uniref:Uncharacterized protein n=1 Tax=Intrasporangium calvum TaxID=53358 RepID=A0ABT5GH04_9MICO|nr:hypothetical protein [Intrasporangium calvum]MDC5697120.1 hypothetical protein [Intrasporangium calvum]
MMNVTGAEFFFLLLWILPILIAYWVIRLAVRHGVVDAHRRLGPDHERLRP